MLLQTSHNRRRFWTSAAAGLLCAARGAFAQTLTQTPEQTIGPYYPDRMPLDQDNDLIVINDNITPAVGQVSWLSGRVLGSNGAPMRNALVEIWQADNNGAYIHSRSPIANRDANFQGYGRFVTGRDGGYLFRTVKPGLYPGRTRHVHVQVTPATGQKLVSQLYVQGESLNNSDGVLNGIRDSAQRASVIRPWATAAGSLAGELAVNWDIVFGVTPPEPPSNRPEILLTNGVVSGAGFQAGLTPGSWISIFGDNLATTTRTWNPSEIVDGKLPTSLDGVSVNVNGQPAAVYFVSPGQINVQAPATATGTATIVVSNAHGSSAPVTADVQTYLPGFFLLDDRYVAAIHSDGSLVNAVSPARPGETIALYGTGFGPTNPNVGTGEVFTGAAPLTVAVSVRVGTTEASVPFAGLTGAGLYQINLVVPNLPDGDHDIVAKVAGARTQSLARLRVMR